MVSTVSRTVSSRSETGPSTLTFWLRSGSRLEVSETIRAQRRDPTGTTSSRGRPRHRETPYDVITHTSVRSSRSERNLTTATIHHFTQSLHGRDDRWPENIFTCQMFVSEKQMLVAFLSGKRTEADIIMHMFTCTTVFVNTFLFLFILYLLNHIAFIQSSTYRVSHQ